MIPESFPEQNVVFARDLLEYLPLPAYVDGTTTVSCWRLTWAERLAVFWSGRLWLSQMNFGGPLQPQLPSVSCPLLRKAHE